MYYVSKQKHEQTWEHVLKLLAIILVHVFIPQIMLSNHNCRVIIPGFPKN